MSSILTNNSAMIALQTLQGINKNLEMTQNEISTGKKIATAKENSAIWAISEVMQSDVDGFNAIKSSLELGQSTVAVGRNAAEQVTDLLGQIKEKIVAAQEDNVDRDKLQTDLASLRDQISGIVSAAQFNGQNLLSNAEKTAGTGTMSVLASLDRASDGSVSSSSITVRKQDLGTQSQVQAGTITNGTAGATFTANATQSGTATVASVTLGQGFSVQLDGAGTFAGIDTAATFATPTLAEAMSQGYVARDGDTVTDVAAKLVDKINKAVAAAGFTSDDLTATVGANGAINVTSTTTDATNTIAVRIDTTVAAGNTIGGGLEDLGNIDISTAAGATSALADIESLTQTAITAAAEFGTGEKRLDIQADFVGKLTDSLKSGIGALVDADMTEASAKLQALQVQQQLGIQSLTIANQAPQNILALFR